MTRGISAESSSSGLEGKGDAAMVSGCPGTRLPTAWYRAAGSPVCSGDALSRVVGLGTESESSIHKTPRERSGDALGNVVGGVGDRDVGVAIKGEH